MSYKNYGNGIGIDYTFKFKYPGDDKEYEYEWEIPFKIACEGIRLYCNYKDVKVDARDKDLYYLFSDLSADMDAMFEEILEMEEFQKLIENDYCREEAYDEWVDDYEYEHSVGKYAEEDDDEDLDESFKKLNIEDITEENIRNRPKGLSYKGVTISFKEKGKKMHSKLNYKFPKDTWLVRETGNATGNEYDNFEEAKKEFIKWVNEGLQESLVKEGDETQMEEELYLYLFPYDGTTQEDIEAAEYYDVEYLGVNRFEDEINYVFRGTKEALEEFGDKWFGGYELHPDYLYLESDFAGDIIKESKDNSQKLNIQLKKGDMFVTNKEEVISNIPDAWLMWDTQYKILKIHEDGSCEVEYTDLNNKEWVGRLDDETDVTINDLNKQVNLPNMIVTYNRKTLANESLTEGVKEEKWNIGSNKLVKQDSDEYRNLVELAKKLELNSPNKLKYTVKRTYEDYGAGMEWYTVIATNNEGDDYQVLNSKQWLDLANNGDVEAVYQDVVKGKYFQDKIKEGKELKESVSWDYFDKFEPLEDTYLPDRGEGENLATQAVTATTKLVYKWYNDGDVYDNQRTGYVDWCNDLSSYANWLSRYIPGASKILDQILDFDYFDMTGSSNRYEHLLKEIADFIFDENRLKQLEKQPKQGSIYNCKGDYELVAVDEEDEDDYYWEYGEEDEDLDESLNESATPKYIIKKVLRNEDKILDHGDGSIVDNKYFDTKEEAENYRNSILHKLGSNNEDGTYFDFIIEESEDLNESKKSLTESLQPGSKVKVISTGIWENKEGEIETIEQDLVTVKVDFAPGKMVRQIFNMDELEEIEPVEESLKEAYNGEEVTVLVTDIEYETDGQEIDLPKEMKFVIEHDPAVDIEDEIANYISNETSFLVISYDYEILVDESVTTLVPPKRDEKGKFKGIKPEYEKDGEFDDYDRAQLSAYKLLKRKQPFAVIYAYNQGKGKILLNPPLVKQSQEEVNQFIDSFKRGKEITRVTVDVMYLSQLDNIEYNLKQRKMIEEVEYDKLNESIEDSLYNTYTIEEIAPVIKNVTINGLIDNGLEKDEAEEEFNAFVESVKDKIKAVYSDSELKVIFALGGPDYYGFELPCTVIVETKDGKYYQAIEDYHGDTIFIGDAFTKVGFEQVECESGKVGEFFGLDVNYEKPFDKHDALMDLYHPFDKIIEYGLKELGENGYGYTFVPLSDFVDYIDDEDWSLLDYEAQIKEVKDFILTSPEAGKLFEIENELYVGSPDTTLDEIIEFFKNEEMDYLPKINQINK